MVAVRAGGEVLQTRAQVCAAFGLTNRALRHYEYMELVQPAVINGQPGYGRRETARLKLILRGKRFGMKLEELRLWLNLYDARGEAEQLQAWLRMADEKEAGLVSRIEELQAALGELRQIREELQSAEAAKMDR